MSDYATGIYAIAISDRSGLQFPYREMVREWNGAWVHYTEYEPKSPLLEPRVIRGDAQGLQHARPGRVEPGVAHMLDFNALSAGVTDSTVVNVFDPGHGYITGDRRRFRDCLSHFPEYPQVSHVQDHDINAAAGHLITKIDDENFSFSPNDIMEEWLEDNCNPGTTTVYVDMDGTLAEWYQAVATYMQDQGLLPDGQWYNMTPADEIAAITADPSYFANLGVRAEANALVDLVMAKNTTWNVLTTTTGSVSKDAHKLAWITTHFGTPGSASGRAPASGSTPGDIDYAPQYNKGGYGGANKMLIDDRTTYIDQFEAAGGKGFKYFESGGIRKFGGANMSVGPLTILP
jgi:hypothetical protein